MTNLEMIKKDLDDIYLGNLFTVETDLNLPSEGKNGKFKSVSTVKRFPR